MTGFGIPVLRSRKTYRFTGCFEFGVGVRCPDLIEIWGICFAYSITGSVRCYTPAIKYCQYHKFTSLRRVHCAFCCRSSASIDNSLLYLTTRSPLLGAPNLAYSDPMPTAKSAMNQSLVSPPLCEVMTFQFASRETLTTFKVSEIVPT